MTAAAADALIDTYQKARAARGEPVTPAELFTAIETDRVFRIPGVRLRKCRDARSARLHLSLHLAVARDGGMLGCCHALELGFVFGTNHMPGMTMFAGTGPAVEKLATQMQDAWIAFARSGDPGCASVGTWAAYTEARRPTMVFGANTALEDAPRDQERRAWDAIPDRNLGTL